MALDQSEINLALETRLRALEGWSREHDGKSNQKWESQERDNGRCAEDRKNLRGHIDEQFSLVFKKLGTLEVKVAAYAATATAAVTAASKYLLP